MRGMFGPLRAKGSKADRKFQAQELFWEAMQARNAATARKLVGKALELDPACIDALTFMVENSDGDLDWRIGGMRTVVECGQRELGVRFFRENRGHFWGLLETRPYMRARQRLAELLMQAGRGDEGLVEYEALLELNPGDNQGIRYLLLGEYLVAGRLERATKLLNAYDDDAGAVFTWGRVLERHAAGDLDGAARALDVARRFNRHAEKYLSGRNAAPRVRGDSYTFGDESEAAVCVDCLGAAWKRHPEAVAWLRAQSPQR
jgi:tetratricopeptide (TPR) repeat protein